MIKKRWRKMTVGFLAAVTLISSFGTIDVSAASLDMSEQSETDYDFMREYLHKFREGMAGT